MIYSKKMDILLINPTINFNKFGIFGKLMEKIPPLGVAYIAGVLQENGFKTEIIDDFVVNIGMKGILDKIKDKKPKIVGISCLTPSANITFAIAREIEKFDKNIVIVSGNIHASFFAEEILKSQDIDIIVHGEAEYTFLEITKSILENRPINSIKGISFKENNIITHNQHIPPIEDLDKLPYPSWELLQIKKYNFLPYNIDSGRCISMLTSRGCPYKCIFCSLPYISKKYRTRKPLNVIEEIKYVEEKYKIRQIAFVDAIFSLNNDFGIKFCEEIIKNKINKKISWICETRVDLIDKELIKLMRLANCKRILFGIESATEEILNDISKKYTLEQIKKSVQICKKAGIEVGGFFMLGLPKDTKETCERTISFAKELDLDFAKFAITVPFPGSKLYDDLKREYKLNRDDWENFTTFNPDAKNLVYAPDMMSKEELIEIQKKAHLMFYLQPRIILKTIFRISKFPLSYIFQIIITILSLFLNLKFKKRKN